METTVEPWAPGETLASPTLVPPHLSLIFTVPVTPMTPTVSYGDRGTHNAAFPDSQGLQDTAPRAVMDEPVLGARFV